MHNGDAVGINIPERSEWSCKVFGMGGDLILNPLKGKHPNFFWRWMQYICFGNEWYKNE